MYFKRMLNVFPMNQTRVLLHIYRIPTYGNLRMVMWIHRITNFKEIKCITGLNRNRKRRSNRYTADWRRIGVTQRRLSCARKKHQLVRTTHHVANSVSVQRILISCSRDRISRQPLRSSRAQAKRTAIGSFCFLKT